MQTGSSFEIASQLIGEDKAVKTVRDIPLAIVLGEDVLVDEPEEYRPPVSGGVSGKEASHNDEPE